MSRKRRRLSSLEVGGVSPFGTQVTGVATVMLPSPAPFLGRNAEAGSVLTVPILDSQGKRGSALS